MLEELTKIYGDIPAVLGLKELLSSELSLEKMPAIQRFNFFMGFYFKNETSGKIFKDINSEILGKNILSINASYGLGLSESVIYTGINRMSKSLLLTDQFIKEASGFKTLPTVNCKSWYSLYKKVSSKYKQVKTFNDKDILVIILNYNTSSTLEESYVSIAYSQREISYKIIKNFLKHSFPENVPVHVIDMYLEYDFYKYTTKDILPEYEFSKEFAALQKIALESYSQANSPTKLREIVLKHPYIRKIFENELDYKVFSVYLRGMSRFKIYDEAVVEFITSYISSQQLDLIRK
jgi:hypothetical protein